MRCHGYMIRCRHRHQGKWQTVWLCTKCGKMMQLDYRTGELRRVG